MKRREALIVLTSAAGLRCVLPPPVPGPPAARVLATDEVPDWSGSSKAERETYVFLTDDDGFIVPGDYSTLNLSTLQEG